ncbi:hypothetical protein V1512DRAFT_264616 [Lipomyces arxii]|uniref:uncharacterized protein n=1 Tax=Lipomyces arxii TaxID=56418 RepID=UPI0034CED35D
MDTGVENIAAQANDEKTERTKRRPPSLVIETVEDKTTHAKGPRSAKEIIQGLALHCVSPGLPPMDNQMMEHVMRTREIEQRQRKLIASRMKEGDDADEDEDEEVQEKRGPPAKIKIVGPAQFVQAGYERAIRSAPLTTEQPRPRPTFLHPPAPTLRPVPMPVRVPQSPVPGRVHRPSRLGSTRPHASMRRHVVERRYPALKRPRQEVCECEDCWAERDGRGERDSRKRRFIEICAEMWDLLIES